MDVGFAVGGLGGDAFDVHTQVILAVTLFATVILASPKLHDGDLVALDF